MTHHQRVARRTKKEEAEIALLEAGWFSSPGAYVILDAQWGSSGKGRLAAEIGRLLGKRIDTVTTNAGPNSGHEAVINGESITLRQLPVSALAIARHHPKKTLTCYVNAGAAINPQVLAKDYDHLMKLPSAVQVVIDPYAALIDKSCLDSESDSLTQISSTMSGAGAAFARKIRRNREFLVGSDPIIIAENRQIMTKIPQHQSQRVFVETSQGWSLGINDGHYPYTTSRDCNIGKALLDARIHPRDLQRTMLMFRSYPIRTGDLDENTSGPCYSDQREISWEDIGKEPEISKVSKRQRRLFTFSWKQAELAIAATRPDDLYLGFCDYLTEPSVTDLVKRLKDLVLKYTGKEPRAVLTSYSKKDELRVA